VPVIVGATAGVRDAIESGQIDEQGVARFRRVLAEHNVDFRVLSGADEARLEMKGAKFCFREAFPAATGDVGVISAGGMSAQVVDHNDISYSLPFQLKTQNARMLAAATNEDDVELLRREIDERIPQYFQQCAMDARPLSEGKLEGKLFVALEMLAWVGTLAGISGQLMPSHEARSRLESFVLGNKEVMCRTKFDARRGWDWHINVPVITALEAMAILDMLDPAAMVLFQNEFKVGTTQLKPTWCLAMYLEVTGGE
jgi:hypothetical protein